MSILCPNSHILYRDIQRQKEKEEQYWVSGAGGVRVNRANGYGLGLGLGLGLEERRNEWRRKGGRRDWRAPAFWSEVSQPSSVVMEPILDCQQFDRILEEARELSHPLLVDWMAAWCRKCIYLKPKLEKLAAEYDSSKVKFYYIDVNKVPQSLVKRGNVSKMPTIQLWKDGEMKAEVIGGHKAWLVIEEVRDMIKQHHSL